MEGLHYDYERDLNFMHESLRDATFQSEAAAHVVDRARRELTEIVLQPDASHEAVYGAAVQFQQAFVNWRSAVQEHVSSEGNVRSFMSYGKSQDYQTQAAHTASLWAQYHQNKLNRAGHPDPKRALIEQGLRAMSDPSQVATLGNEVPEHLQRDLVQATYKDLVPGKLVFCSTNIFYTGGRWPGSYSYIYACVLEYEPFSSKCWIATREAVPSGTVEAFDVDSSSLVIPRILKA